MTTDYLTCGECLREFPLQRITLFIQHKKLDCDDETEEQDRDPELQCNYCPRGFMTAWALMVHAQLTHNLKLFLEKASRSLRKPDKFSHVDQSGYSDMPLEFSPLNHHFGSSLTTHDATPMDALVSSLQNKPNEDVRTSLTPGEDRTIEQYCKIADKSSTEDNAESISKHCLEQCKMGSSASIVPRNNKTRTIQAGEVTKQLLDSRSPEKKVIISNNTPECSNLQISPDQIPECSNLQISPDQIPECSNLQISPNQIPECSNLQISPDQIPECSNLQISPDQIPECSNLQISPDQIPECSNLQISPDQIPECSNLQISPDQIPECSNLQISPDQIPVCSNLQISPDQIPVCSNLQISPDQIPVCSNLQISPNQIPVCSNIQISPNQIPVCSNIQISPNQIPVCSNIQISPNQKLGVLPMSQTSLFPQCCSTPLTMSSHPVASSIEILPRTSFMYQPEPAVAILKQKLSPQALTARTSLDNHKNSAHDPATIMSNSMTATSNSPSELPWLIASSSDSSSGIILSSICSRQMSQSNDQRITSIDMSVDSTIPLFKITNVKSAKRQREESSNVAPGNYVAGIEIENPSAECCDIKGCGVTVIPGSHENLQKCCNAVVPKKRKRHMEQKHTPFSWSSSRYARRKMLHRSLSSNVARSTTSQYVGKPSAGTIYIDLEPDLLKMTSDDEEGQTFKVTQSASPGVRLTATSESPVKCSEKPVGQSKPHTLILKPGAVFSIPFTYTIPTSMANPVTSSFSVSRGTVSSVDSVAQSSTSSAHASNPDQEAVDGNHTNLNMPGIVSYSSTVGNDQAIDGGPEKMRLHQTKPFPCEKCAMAFNQRIHLKKHMSKHTGIKPYKCEECNYSTVERSHLKVHIRIHTGEKPFKCTFCEYATAQNSTLKIHLKRHHGGKMFQCQSCEKQFTQAEQLKGHKWEHGSKVVATPEQKALEDVRTPGGLGTSPSQSSVPSHLSTIPSQNSSDGQTRNLSPVEVKTRKSTNQQAVSGHVNNLTEESTNWQGEGSTNQQAVSSHVDNFTEESINLQGEGSTNQQAVSGHVDDLIEKSTNSHGVSSKVYNLTEKSTDQKTDNKKSTNESAYNIVRVKQETTNQSLT